LISLINSANLYVVRRQACREYSEHICVVLLTYLLHHVLKHGVPVSEGCVQVSKGVSPYPHPIYIYIYIPILASSASVLGCEREQGRFKQAREGAARGAREAVREQWGSKGSSERARASREGARGSREGAGGSREGAQERARGACSSSRL
jgi:hypothetical protein